MRGFLIGQTTPRPDEVFRYVAQYNARHLISEMDPESWLRSRDSVPFDLRKDGLDAIKLASVMAFDPDVPMKHVLTSSTSSSMRHRAHPSRCAVAC